MSAVPIPAALASILANDEFAHRPLRRPDYESDSKALRDLAHDLTTSPGGVLQKLSDTALALCRADSAGISLLERKDGKQIFRWHAVSGQWTPYLWATMPREFSPCGTVLDFKAGQLMVQPERYFTPIKQMTPQVCEVLLIPFRVDGEIVGTLWVILHSDRRVFDLEDRRVVSNLAAFAAKAHQRFSALKRAALDAATTPVDTGALKPVLILDDNTDFAESVTQLLEHRRNEVFVTRDIGNALELARRVGPAVVFVDVAMLDLEGYELAKRLRAALGSAAHLVAFTPFHDVRQQLAAADAGFDQYIVKPIDAAFLESLLA